MTKFFGITPDNNGFGSQCHLFYKQEFFVYVRAYQDVEALTSHARSASHKELN